MPGVSKYLNGPNGSAAACNASQVHNGPKGAIVICNNPNMPNGPKVRVVRDVMAVAVSPLEPWWYLPSSFIHHAFTYA